MPPVKQGQLTRDPLHRFQCWRLPVEFSSTMAADTTPLSIKKGDKQ